MKEECSTFQEFCKLVNPKRRVRYSMEPSERGGCWLCLSGIAKEGHLLVVDINLRDFLSNKELRRKVPINEWCRINYLSKFPKVYEGRYVEGENT